MEHVFVENEIFGSASVKSVLNEGHYIRAKRGISLLAEAIQRLQIEEFLKQANTSDFNQLFEEIGNFSSHFTSTDSGNYPIHNIWKRCKEHIIKFEVGLQIFVEEGKKRSKQFYYWSIFLDSMVPVLRNLTESLRSGNWLLYLSSIRDAVPLFFAFNYTNYSRWTPLYYEDCISLEAQFPEIYDEFRKGNFVARLTCSAVQMDQALEKEYNKIAKGQGGIIGFTNRKKAVAQWNLIKHEKMQYIKVLQTLCNANQDSEYTLHHEFSKTITESNEKCIEQIQKFISERENPFDNSCKLVTNIVTEAKMNSDRAEYLLRCVKDTVTFYIIIFRFSFLLMVILYDMISKTFRNPE